MRRTLSTASLRCLETWKNSFSLIPTASSSSSLGAPSQLIEEGRVNLEECFVDATFAAAKGGGTAVGLTRKGKGTKVQLVVDAKGVPLALSLDAASVGETAMVQGGFGRFRDAGHRTL